MGTMRGLSPVPVGMPSASLVVVGAGRRTSRFRLDGPWLVLAEDAEGEDELSGWSTDADPLAELAAGEFGASVSMCDSRPWSSRPRVWRQLPLAHRTDARGAMPGRGGCIPAMNGALPTGPPTPLSL